MQAVAYGLPSMSIVDLDASVPNSGPDSTNTAHCDVRSGRIVLEQRGARRSLAVVAVTCCLSYELTIKSHLPQPARLTRRLNPTWTPQIGGPTNSSSKFQQFAATSNLSLPANSSIWNYRSADNTQIELLHVHPISFYLARAPLSALVLQQPSFPPPPAICTGRVSSSTSCLPQMP